MNVLTLFQKEDNQLLHLIKQKVLLDKQIQGQFFFLNAWFGALVVLNLLNKKNKNTHKEKERDKKVKIF